MLGCRFVLRKCNQNYGHVSKRNKMKPPQQVERETNCQWTDVTTAREWQGIISSNKMYQCHQCPFNTTDIHSLKRHNLKHTGEKPYVCPYCPYKAARKDLMKEHTKTHTGERPYKCPYCSYSASQRNSLKAHIRRHTGEKPYACSFCSYRATQKSTLKTHMLTHKVNENAGL